MARNEGCKTKPSSVFQLSLDIMQAPRRLLAQYVAPGAFASSLASGEDWPSCLGCTDNYVPQTNGFTRATRATLRAASYQDFEAAGPDNVQACKPCNTTAA
jgi:hypothetical protein